MRIDQNTGAGDPIEVDLRDMEQKLRASPVVSIHRLARLAQMRSKCPTERTLAWLYSLLMELGEEMFLLFAPFMLEILRDAVPPRRRLSNRALLKVARKVSKYPFFRSLNAKLRKYHARGNPTPFVEVRPHVRDGVPVQGHLRLLGNQHLKRLPVDGEPENVVRLIRVLAGLREYEIGEDSRVMLTNVPWFH